MVAIQQAVSLNLIKDELISSLKKAEKSLEAFIDDRSDSNHLAVARDAFHEIGSICRVIDLKGASELCIELETMSQGLLDGNSIGDGDKQLSALGQGVMTLEKYFEYVVLKQRTYPQLLIDSINQVRRASLKPIVGEALFFDIAQDRGRYPEAADSEVALSEVPKLGRRLRHMYQVGLLGIMRNESPTTSAKLMARAMERVDSLCGNAAKNSEFIWLARGVLETMAMGGISINMTRKAILSQVDRQLKNLVYNTEQAIQQPVDEALCKELLCLIAMASEHSPTAREIELHYELRRYNLSDEELQREMEDMNGPGGSVIRAVAETLKSELVEIKLSLEKAVKGAEGGFLKVADSLQGIASTLLILGLSKESQNVKEQADLVREWKSDAIDVEGEQFQTLIDYLLSVENAVAKLEKSYSGADQGSSEGSSNVSVYQLDDAKSTVIGESRSGLSMAKRSLSAYVDENWETAHIQNLPDTLTAIGGGLAFLELGRARSIVDASVQFIKDRLIDGGENPTLTDMETFADVISSVDYFLESIAEQKPIGESILDIAEEALDELGFPVLHAA